MLEANVYDNFNPNYYNISDFTLPNGKKDKRGLPIPKARCQVIDYELWETGYLYTSSATLTVSVEVGDIVQILFPEVVPIEEALGKKKKEVFLHPKQGVKSLIMNCGKQVIFTLHQLH